MKKKAIAACIASLMAAGPASAHHSFAMFDSEKTLFVDGTVKEVELSNPHAWLYVTAKDAQGKAAEWGIEMGGVAAVARLGWNANTVKPGDKIVVEIHPLKDGSYGGQYVNAKLADGKSIGGGDSGLPQPLR